MEMHPDISALESPVDEESEADRKARYAREAKVLAKAHADIAAGLGIEDDDLEAWLDRLDLDAEAPPSTPPVGR